MGKDNIRRQTEQLVTGALYDFCAWLSSRPRSTCVGAKEDVVPLVERLKEFSSQRGLDMDDPNHDWRDQVNTFATARQSFREGFSRDDGMFGVYVDNIAMLLYDELGGSDADAQDNPFKDKSLRDAVAAKVIFKMTDYKEATP